MSIIIKQVTKNLLRLLDETEVMPFCDIHLCWSRHASIRLHQKIASFYAGKVLVSPLAWTVFALKIWNPLFMNILRKFCSLFDHPLRLLLINIIVLLMLRVLRCCSMPSSFRGETFFSSSVTDSRHFWNPQIMSMARRRYSKQTSAKATSIELCSFVPAFCSAITPLES